MSAKRVLGLISLLLGIYLIVSASIGFAYLNWAAITGYTYAYYNTIGFLMSLTPIPFLSFCSGSACEAGGGGFSFLIADIITGFVGVLLIVLGRRKRR